MAGENKKHTRRAILRAGLGALTGAGLYGSLGYGLGKVYEAGRDVYGGIKKAAELVDKNNPLNYFKRGEEQKQNTQETRRGFFERLTAAFNTYPVESSTALGASLGAFRGYSKRKKNIREAEMRDDISYIKKKVESLEEKTKNDKNGALMIFFGIVGIFYSLTSISFGFTGYFIYAGNDDTLLINSVILSFSMMLVLYGFYTKNKAY